VVTVVDEGMVAVGVVVAGLATPVRLVSVAIGAGVEAQAALSRTAATAVVRRPGMRPGDPGTTRPSPLLRSAGLQG
jgi:hypothetical protein